MASLWTGVFLGVCQMEAWPVAWIALAPLSVACHGQDKRAGAFFGFLSGLLAGAALYGLLPYGWLLYSVLVVYCAVHMAGFGVGVAWLSHRLPSWARVLLPALLWTGFEYLRRFGTVAFPISLSGSQPHLLSLAQISAVTGSHGLSFLVALPAGLVLEAVVARALPRRESVAVAGLIAVVAGLGALTLSTPLPEDSPIRVAGVQTGLPNWVYRIHAASSRHGDLVHETLFQLSEEAVSRRAEVVIWPETALHHPVLVRADLREPIAALARRAKATFLVGATRSDTTGHYNTVVHFPADGSPLSWQDKIRPAGYAEWHVTPGKKREPFDTPSGRFGMLICLESIFPQDGRELVALGSEVLVVTTNDAGFRRSPIPEFHARRSLFRAIETGRWVVHLSQAGPSYVFDPRGRTRASRPLFERGLLEAVVHRSQRMTPYQVVGDVFSWMVWLAIVGLAAFARSRASHDSAA